MWKFVMGAMTMLSLALTIPRPELPKLPEPAVRQLGDVTDFQTIVVSGKPYTQLTTSRGRRVAIKGVIRVAEGDPVRLVHSKGRFWDATEVEINGERHAASRIE